VPEYFIGLWSTALPIILGAKHFWEQTSAFSSSTAVFYAVYGVVFGTVLYQRRGALLGLLRGNVDRQEPLEIFLLFIPVACAIFTVSSFGWLSQAPRYLLPLYVGLFIVCGAFVHYVSRVSSALGVVCALVFCGLNLASCYAGGRALPGEPIVYDGDRVARDHSEIISALDSLGIRYVRANYWIGYRIAFETKERVLFGVFGEPRQVRIPEYEEPMLREGSDLVPIIAVPKQRESLARGLHRLGYAFDELFASGYTLFYNLRRTAGDPQLLSGSLISKVEGSGGQDASKAVDGADDTRWGTGQSQRQGQYFRVVFSRPVRLQQISYRMGKWPQDYPRGMEVQVRGLSGEVRTLLSSEDYRDIAPLLADGELRLRVDAQDVVEVTLRQVGSHPILDWSIAELGFYGVSGGAASK
jgi:hypothetical protein